ncbi:MAG: DUF2862 domain-containing protein [Cyanobacteriota bacterium]|nr:DUF2862 domain-containing protein [Cyanobacteriota bacterium]
MAMTTLIKPGDKVRIRTVRDRGQEAIKPRLGTEAVVLTRRVVDGSGVGYNVQFADQSTQWFFDQEIEGV